MEGSYFIAVRIAAGRKHDRAGYQVVRGPAGTPVVQLIEPANKKRGTRQQDHRERKLAHDQNVAKTLMPAAAGRAAPTAFQGLVHAQPHCEKRGRQTEGEAP